MWLKFFITRYFWINLLLALIALIVIGFIANITLGIVTRHGEEMKVPDLKGVTLNKAIEIIEQNGLKYQIRDSVFMDNMPRMSIVEQSPLADEKVKKGRIIYLTVNALDVPQVMLKFEQLHGSSREVKMYLEGMGMKLGQRIERKGTYDDVVIEAIYLGRKIAEDIEVPKGSKIDLVVEVTKLSKPDEDLGLNDEVEIPDLIDLTLGEARDKLNELGLKMGDPIKKNVKMDTLDATIWKQKPSFKKNKLIEVGSEIDVYIK
ncbi:MAG: PASTA domain-containing protein [Bacteroidota bacterium]|nr:PASTA domain-containing protein [Bacteroidota bacterium]